MTRVVYLLSDGQGRLKIGKADKLDRRKRAIEIEVGQALTVADTIPASYALERSLHLECQDWRLTGEWFRDCSEVRAAFAAAKGAQDSSPASKTDATIAAADARAKAALEHDLGQIVGLVSGRTGKWGKDFALNYIADTYNLPYWLLRHIHYRTVTSPSAGVCQLIHDVYLAELQLMVDQLKSHIDIMNDGGDPPFELERAAAKALAAKIAARRAR